MRLDLRRGSKDAPLVHDRPDERAGGDEEAIFGRIRCPQCSWQPVPSSMWSCVSVGAPEHFSEGCGEVWNTFLTRGRCPGCAHQWRFTSCLRCSQWSLHEDWYEEPGQGSDPRRD